ncbi:MAG: response regulator [Bacteroidales bacterium]
MDKIKIIIVDDHHLFRNGLKLLLETIPEFEIAGEASSGLEFLEILLKVDADIALVDINMPALDGIEATSQALKIKPGLQIIALSMYGEEDYYYKMTDAGARGFILKDSDISEVKEAIYTVRRGGSYFSQQLLHNVIQKIKHRETEIKAARLSKREKEILMKICEGSSNQEIADELFISKRTVDKHRANLLSKTNSKNTASLILYAIKNKLIKI